MIHIIHLFIESGSARARGEYAAALFAAIPGTSTRIQLGANGLFIDGCSIELLPPGRAHLSHSFGDITTTQRAQAGASLDALEGHPELAAAVDTCGPIPLVIAVMDKAGARLYHRVQQTVRGVLYLCYFSAPPSQRVHRSPEDLGSLRQLLDQGQSRWQAVRPLLSDDCAYSKWRADFEMERKFTFSEIPDTWRLVRSLHREICEGALPGFVPELDRDFQVFDYESHIFAVRGAPEEQGYISFIPQADGRMTIKRKWFTRNAEIRRESLYPDRDMDVTQIPAHVAHVVHAPTHRLPPFRRKRFDVNFESLATGNVYGIYFDICRTVERPTHGFSQCEVEYCRSRTFETLRQVTEEFERVAGFTSDFLKRAGCSFANDLYSKLDFALEASELVERAEP